MATVFLDLESGSDAADGLSFANRKKTLAGASAIANPGDTVRIMASTTPNSLGVNGTFARGSTKITLASALTQSIDEGESAWTPSANVTCDTSTARKQGATAARIAVAAGFGTGLAAYKAFSTTDFSSRQQLSFWLHQSAGTLSGFTIKLCSDNAGVTPVNSFAIPATNVLGSFSSRIVIDLGSAMGSSIQSIALYVDSDVGAQTWVLDNIIACNAPGTGELTHKTLIGKANSLGAGGDDSETWYAIRAIEGTTVTLDLLNSSNAGSTTNGRYWGVSETITAYSLFPSYVPTSVVSADLQWTAGGTDTQTLTISGGWNRTDMSTQTGQTWLAVGNAPTTGLSMSIVASYLDWSRFHIAMGTSQNGFWSLGHSTFETMHCISITGNTISGNDITITKLIQANGTTGITFNGMEITAGVGILSDQSNLSFVNTVGSTFTIDDNSVNTGVTPSHSSKIIFNGTTYGSFGEASTAAAVWTDDDRTLTEDVGITSNIKKNQALAAFQFTMIDAVTKLPVSGKAVTVNRSIDGGAFGSGTLSSVTELSDGVYGVDFGAGDLNGNVVVLKATATGCDVTLERLTTQP